MRRLREERGQVMPLLALGLLAALLGVSALVIDAGAWYQAHRSAQAAADAAALAAAQRLPASSAAEATSLAKAYVAVNGATLEGGPVFKSVTAPNDTVTVRVVRVVPSVFARVLGVDQVTVRATATARASAPSRAGRVVPVGVNRNHQALRCLPGCLGRPTQLVHEPNAIDAPGAFGLLDLENTQGSVATHVLESWVRHGYPEELAPGPYESVPGNRFNSGPVSDAFDAIVAAGQPVLVPIYSSVSGSGANAIYTVIGFGAFLPTAWEPHAGGGSSILSGRFVDVVIPGGGGDDAAAYYGAKGVRLVG